MRATAVLSEKPAAVVFGGGLERRASAIPRTQSLKCPRRNRLFDAELLIPAGLGEEVDSVEIETIAAEAPADGQAQAGESQAEPTTTEPQRDWVADELAEWRKSSAATLRTYATTMLTTSSGGVPVYFAVLKYLGWEQADFGAGLVAVSVLPPALLFLAALAFTLALRPSLSTNLEPQDYLSLRNHRLTQMYQRASIGTLLFGSALVIAIAVFAIVMEQST